MASSYELGKVMGIPIRLHISLLIFIPFFIFQLTSSGAPFLLALAAIVGLYLSVALHELGHSAVAIRKNCPVRQILLLPIGGVAQLERLPEKPSDEMLIAIAGPAVSFTLALLGVPLWLLSASLQSGWWTSLFVSLALVNLLLGAFNLLPAFPMDGGRVFRAFMTPKVGRLKATEYAMKAGRFMAIAFVLIGLFKLNLLLAAIGVFVYIAAGAEYRSVQIQEQMGRGAGVHPWFTQARQPAPSRMPPPTPTSNPGDDGVYVSPPPYARKQPPPTP